MKEQSTYKEILNLGVPSFLETLFTTFASIIDSKMVAALGVNAISAVSVTNQPRLFAFSLFFAVNTVTSSLVARDYAQLRVDLLDGPIEDIPRAFSQLRDKKLLFEVLYSYYRIGNLRNQINHTSVDRADVEADGTLSRHDMRENLDVQLGRFIELYDTACRKTVKTREPVILEPRRFKGYTRHNELKPFETAHDLTTENSYICNYNGQEIHIRINMVMPEEDQYDEMDEK